MSTLEAALRRWVDRDREITQENKTGFAKVLDILNRGTEGSASFFDELVFDPTDRNLFEGWWEGVKGEGTAETFTQLLEKSGWKPDSKVGKFLRGATGFALDVGLDPLTYVSIGAAPALTKALPRAGKLLTAGKSLDEIEKMTGGGKGLRRAAELIDRAEKAGDPRAAPVVQKLLKGEKITKAEEAALGARTLVGMQGLLGTGRFLQLVPRGASMLAFEQGARMIDDLKKTKLVNPVVVGFTKAFNQFGTLKAKYPELWESLKSGRQRAQAATAEGWRRTLQYLDLTKNVDEGESKLILNMLEKGDFEKQVSWHDVTELVNRSPHIRLDLGIPEGKRLTDEQAVDVVTTWLGEFDHFIDQFGPKGIWHAGRQLKEIRELNEKIDLLADQISWGEARLKKLQKEVDEGTGEVKQLVDQKNLVAVSRKSLEKLEARKTDLVDTIYTQSPELGEALEELAEQHLGSGIYGTVKGPVNHLVYEGRVIKLPNQITTDYIQSLVEEAGVYRQLSGVRGIGTGTLVWKEIPIKVWRKGAEGTEDQFYVPGFQFDPEIANRGLVESDLPRLLQRVDPRYVITKSDGKKYVRIPYLVKEFVDIDSELTKSFHGLPANRVVKNNTIRSFEKMLAQASRKGAILSDLHEGNLVVNRRGFTHLIDLGLAETGNVDNLLDVTRAWETNLLSFARHILQHTRFRSRELAQEAEGLLWDSAATSGAATAELADRAQALLQAAGYRLSFMSRRTVFQNRTPKVLSESQIERLARSLTKRGVPEEEAKRIAKERARASPHIVAEIEYPRVDPETVKTLEQEKARLLGDRQHLQVSILREARRAGIRPSETQVAKDLRKIDEQIRAIDAELENLTQLRRLEEPFEKTKKIATIRQIPLAVKLSPEGRDAFEAVQAWRDELQQHLIDNGVLTEEFVTSFEKAHGLQHVRHFRKTDPETLAKRFFHAVGQLGKKPRFLKPRKIEGAIQDINDRMGREFFETDIAKIMFARHAEVFEAVENWRLVQRVADNFSRPAKEVFDPRTKKTRVTADIPGWTVVRDHPLLANRQIPEDLAEDVKRAIGFTRSTAWKKYFDPMQGWIKKWLLFLYPSFFIRNVVSGAAWMNWFAGVRPGSELEVFHNVFGNRSILQAAKQFVKDDRKLHELGRVAVRGKKTIRGLNMTWQDLLDEFHAQGVSGRGFGGPGGEFARKAWQDVSSLPSWKSQVLGGVFGGDSNRFIRFGMKVQEWSEDVLRFSHYLDRRRKGWSPADAALSVKKYHYDYSDLSDTERTIFRRIFPFYAWLRNNLPRQVQNAVIRPGKFAVPAKAVNQVQREAGGPPPASAIVPKWLDRNLGVRFRWNKETGSYEYFLLRSWLPAADVASLFSPGETITQSLDPLLKTAIEQISGQSLFFDRPLEEFEGQTRTLLSPEAGRVLAKVPGADPVTRLLEATLGRAVGAVPAPLEEGIAVRGRAESALRQFRPISETRRLLETTARAGKAVGLSTSLIGKSYGMEPRRARDFLLLDKRRHLSKLKTDLSRALRDKQLQRALRIEDKMRILAREIVEIERARVSS